MQERADAGDSHAGGPSPKSIAQIVLVVVLAVVVGSFVGQNNDSVDVDLLGWSGSAPLWLLMVIALAVGSVATLLVGYILRTRRRR